jgi:hypothetical protein
MARPKKKPAKKQPKLAVVPPVQAPENPPRQQHQEEQPPHQQPTPPAGGVSDSDAPGRAELEKLAGQPDQPAPGAEAPEEPRVPVFLVTEEHRHVTGFLTGKACDLVQGVLPVRYGQDTRDTLNGALAPVVAKHYDKFPLWFLLWKEEIVAAGVVSKVVFDTWKEVRRVNQIEADIEELASKYRTEGANRKVARERAMHELGYSEGPQPAAAAA